ncbi:MAG: hypothetical protein EAY81_11685 [Bacteroidetes bacterium]|nr:MAG: hypothetical protein EAY81_11685 [Bacteroidota bacterium]
MYGQDNASTLLKASKEDANLLLNAYASPILKSIGAGLNSGWYQTAKPLGAGGFNLNFNIGVSLIPNADQQFDVNTLGLKELTLVKGQSSSLSPTALGDNKSGPQMELRAENPLAPGSDTSVLKFNMPAGAGINFGPLPLAQLSVGVGFGTEVGIRYIPEINTGEFKSGLFGFSVKHDFKQWIPGIKAAPFDLSAMFGYTSMSGEVAFTGSNSVQAPTDNNIYNPNPNKVYSDQHLEYSGSGWTSNLIISKKLGPFTPYLGIGYQSSTVEASVKGAYPVVINNDFADATNPNHPSFGKPAKIQELKDPFTVKGSLSGFRANAGFRLKFAVVTLHADYTLADYHLFNVGLGISMQSLVPPKM